MYGKVKTADLMKGAGFDWMQRPNKGSMTRQEAVAPTPQQAIAQTSQTGGGVDYWKSQNGQFVGYKDKEGRARIVLKQRLSAGNQNDDSSVGNKAEEQKSTKADNTLVQQNPDNTMPTRRGSAATQGTDTQPLSEQELEDFQRQEQEPNQAIKNFNEYGKKAKAEAQKIADERAGGEANPTPAPIDRHQRSQVDETKADPEEVKALQDSLGLDAQGGNGVSGYDDILAMMRTNTLNEGDMARRQRSREIVTGLGDLVSSIANLWATTKGAPNSYDNGKGMTATSQSRYDRELARRKAQNEQILNYYRVKKAAEDDAETKEYRRQMLAVRQQEADRRQAESDAKIKREDDVAQARANLYKAQESKANADTVKKKGENQYAVTYWEKYSQYRLTSSHEEADRLANIDAAAAEQKYLDEENARKNKAANKKSGSSGSNKSKTNKKKSKDKLYGSKPRLY